MFQTKVVENMETHVFYSIHFPPETGAVYWEK